MFEPWEPIILIGQRGNAMQSFPCSITIQARTGVASDGSNNPQNFYCVVCGGIVLAKYVDLAPAKMELARLREEWDQCAQMRPRTFQFAKDVKKEEEEE